MDMSLCSRFAFRLGRASEPIWRRLMLPWTGAIAKLCMTSGCIMYLVKQARIAWILGCWVGFTWFDWFPFCLKKQSVGWDQKWCQGQYLSIGMPQAYYLFTTNENQTNQSKPTQNPIPPTLFLFSLEVSSNWKRLHKSITSSETWQEAMCFYFSSLRPEAGPCPDGHHSVFEHWVRNPVPSPANGNMTFFCGSWSPLFEIVRKATEIK